MQNRTFGAFRRSGATLGGLWDDFGWHLGSLGFQKVAFGYPLGSLWAARGVIWAPFGDLWGTFACKKASVFTMRCSGSLFAPLSDDF